MPASLNILFTAKDTMSPAIRGIRGELAKATTGMRRFGNSWASLLAGLGVFQLGRGFIEANSELEQMQFKLEAMLGSAERGAQAFEWVKNFQKNLPITDIKTTTDAFIQLVSAGIDPAGGALEGLITASAKFGLTAGDIKGVTRALRQTTAVTNAQKQELNQLAERIPKIQKLIADELGMTQDNFLRQMELRNLQSTDVAKATLRALQKEGEGVAERFSKTWQAGIARIETAWFELLTSVGQTGIFDDLKKGVTEVTSFINRNLNAIVASFKIMRDNIKIIGSDLVSIGLNFSGMAEFFTGITTDITYMIRLSITSLKVGIDSIVQSMKQMLAKVQIFQNAKALELGTFFSIDSVESQMEKVKGQIIEATKLFFETANRDPNKLTKKQAKIQQDLLEKGRKNIEALKKEWIGLYAVQSKYNKEFGNEDKNAPIPLEQGAEKFKKILDEYNQKIAEVKKLFEDARGKDNPLLDIPNNLPSGTEGLDSVTGIGKDPKYTGAESFYIGWMDSLEKTKAGFKVAFDDMKNVGTFMADSVTGALTDGFNSFFDSLIDGNIKSLKDAILDFLTSIAKAINQQLSQQLATGILGQVGSMFAGGATAYPSPYIGAGNGVQGPLNANGMYKASSTTQKVEIVNQTGEPIRAKKAEVRQDPSGMVMSIVIDAISRNKGGSRDMLRSSLA